MKVGQKVVITEEGIGHYLKPLTIGTIVGTHGHFGGLLVKGKANDDAQYENGELTQLLMIGDYELIPEGTIPEEEENEA